MSEPNLAEDPSDHLIDSSPLDDQAMVSSSLEVEQFAIAGFWHRLFAAFVDGALLGAVCSALVFLLGPMAFRLGSWGRVVGLLIGTIYLGLFNSEVTHGQTLGKSLLGIRVVNLSGQPISLNRSLGRAAVLSFFVTISQAGFKIERIGTGFLNFGPELYYKPESLIPIPVLGSVLWAIAIFGLILLLYGLIFNGTTRQGPHDLLFGTVVAEVRSDEVAIIPTDKLTRQRNVNIGCLAVAGVVGLLIGLSLLYFYQIALQQPRFALLADLTADGRIINVQISDGSPVDARFVLGPTCYPLEERCPNLIENAVRTIASYYDPSDQPREIRVSVYSQAEFGWIKLVQRDDTIWQLDEL